MTLPATPRHWAKGENVTAALLNTHWRDAINRLHWRGAHQTADITKTSNTTLSDLTGLVIPVVSGDRWLLFAHSFFISNAVADAKWALTAPGGSTGRYGIVGPGAGIGDLSTPTFGTGLARAISGVNEDNQMLWADVTAGATGNLQIQAAQNTSDAVNTIFRQYSPIIGLRISGGNSPVASFSAAQVISAANFQSWLSDNLNDIRIKDGSLREEVDALNTATLKNLPGMSFPVKAGETWAWFSFLYFTSTAGGDVACGATAPNDSAGRYGLVGSDSPMSPGSSSTFGAAVKMAVANTNEQCASFNGLVVAANDGTVQMQAAQATASPGETMTMKQDSWFVAFRTDR